MLDVKLQELLAPVVTALGYELWGIERLSQGRRTLLLRVYIDNPKGITLDDCEQVSYQLSGVLDVEDPIAGRYTLEVSSPGLDRPLFTLEHFKRFIGHQVKVKVVPPLQARQNFVGILQKVEDLNVIILVDGLEYHLPYPQIAKARLVPEWYPQSR